MIIRDAEQSEREQVLNLTLKAYGEYQGDAPEGFWDVYVTNIREAVLNGPDIERIVAEIDGQLVGSVLLCKRSFNFDEPEIRLLSIDPGFRQKGIAGKLMGECENRLRNRGHLRVVLHTTSLMETARQMYERGGYRRLEEIDFSPVPGFVVVGYVKDLQNAETVSR